ncbi:MAG: hypothetical protein RNU03_05750 [Candidatus Sedimenticola sp. (ex Thyasira tokunagai)]
MNNIRTITSLVLVALLVMGCATNEEKLKPKPELKIPSGDLDYKPAPPGPPTWV